MCLATPSKVIKIRNNKAKVKSRLHGEQVRHHFHEADLSLLKKVKIGDYLLIHDGMAINKVPKVEAEKILKMINEPNK